MSEDFSFQQLIDTYVALRERADELLPRPQPLIDPQYTFYVYREGPEAHLYINKAGRFFIRHLFDDHEFRRVMYQAVSLSFGRELMMWHQVCKAVPVVWEYF